MDIRELTADDGMLLKDIRLRALKDAPYAFGGIETFDAESALADSDWHRLAAEAGGRVPEWRDRCVTYIVFQGNDACGTGSSYLCRRVPGRAYFSAAWVDPRFRRQGIGGILVRKTMEWAKAHGADHVRLWVDDTNPDASRFYGGLGFIEAGESRPVGPGAVVCERSFEVRL